MNLSTEPSLSANIYCAERIDEVILHCIAPFWRESCSSGQSPGYLRMQRHPRGGAHLKIRIHAPEALATGLGRSLEAAVMSYFESIAAVPLPERRPAPNAPAMDVEDEAPQDHPDRSFVWTHYRRSHVEFGGAPLLDNDGYILRMVRCQAEVTERVLALKPDEHGIVPFHVRQNTLLQLAMASLSVLPWSMETRLAYLAYHRNWLVRFFLLLAGVNRNAKKAAEMMARFDANVQKLGSSIEIYRTAADTQWARKGDAASRADDAEASWRVAIEDLGRYVATFAANPNLKSDRSPTTLMFLALFKVHVALGNQLGLRTSDEAFAYHLLLSVSGGAQRYGFTFDPVVPTETP